MSCTEGTAVCWDKPCDAEGREDFKQRATPWAECFVLDLLGVL